MGPRKIPGKKISEDDFSKGVFLWLRNTLKPVDYPKTNAGVAGIVRSAGDEARNRIIAAVPEKSGSMYVIFGFESGNGPAFGALCLNEPEKMVLPGKKIDSRFNGFRRKGNQGKIVKERYFAASGKANAIPVQRIDRSWIFERGSKGFIPELDKMRVGIIGCGSLGAQIAMLLAQSGIRNFLLIDPEALSFDNIARHLLGGQYVDQAKVIALQNHLQSHFPGILDINPREEDWETTFHSPTDRKLLLSCDLLVSTVGSWDVESALNCGFNGTEDFPPIVYGWTEPYGFAGHALLVTGVGGCFTCGMDRFGKFRYEITNWPEDAVQKRAPACGVTYQPYGVLDIVQTQAMIAGLCMKFVTGRVHRSQHWAWVGNIGGLLETDGELMKGLSDYYGEVSQGNRLIKREWPVDTECQYRH